MALRYTNLARNLIILLHLYSLYMHTDLLKLFVCLFPGRNTVAEHFMLKTHAKIFIFTGFKVFFKSLTN